MGSPAHKEASQDFVAQALLPGIYACRKATCGREPQAASHQGNGQQKQPALIRLAPIGFFIAPLMVTLCAMNYYSRDYKKWLETQTVGEAFNRKLF